MIPQLVQMWRAMLSPGGTRCSTRAPQALQKFMRLPIQGIEGALYKDDPSLHVAGLRVATCG